MNLLECVDEEDTLAAEQEEAIKALPPRDPNIVYERQGIDFIQVPRGCHKTGIDNSNIKSAH